MVALTQADFWMTVVAALSVGIIYTWYGWKRASIRFEQQIDEMGEEHKRALAGPLAQMKIPECEEPTCRNFTGRDIVTGENAMFCEEHYGVKPMLTMQDAVDRTGRGPNEEDEPSCPNHNCDCGEILPQTGRCDDCDCECHDTVEVRFLLRRIDRLEYDKLNNKTQIELLEKALTRHKNQKERIRDGEGLYGALGFNKPSKTQVPQQKPNLTPDEIINVYETLGLAMMGGSASSAVIKQLSFSGGKIIPSSSIDCRNCNHHRASHKPLNDPKIHMCMTLGCGCQKYK